jgi:hypothetical protein
LLVLVALYSCSFAWCVRRVPAAAHVRILDATSIPD